MSVHLHPYVARKLSSALDWTSCRPSRYEGLYSAYEESLQWLEDFDDLPRPVRRLLEEIRGATGRMAAENRLAHARKRIAAMSEADVCALIDRLRAAMQGIPAKSTSPARDVIANA